VPPVEVRTSLLFGLLILLACWLIAVLLTKLALKWMRGRAEGDEDAIEAVEQIREWVHSLMGPVLIGILILWGLAFVMTGWVIPSSKEDPTGTLEESVEPGQLFQGQNNPETRKEEIRKEGTEIQQEKMENLGDFREQFFKDRKESKSDEEVDSD